MQEKKGDSLIAKIVYTLGIILLIRVGNFIPVPNVEQEYLINILNSNPSLKTFFNSETLVLSLFSLGIIPSINASILIQLLTSAVPYLERLQKIILTGNPKAIVLDGNDIIEGREMIFLMKKDRFVINKRVRAKLFPKNKK